jgi:beta-fructofuranosidase
MFPYAPGQSELGDIEVVAGEDGRLHLFHLTLPNHDVVHHAVSRDGLTWEPLPAAIRTGDPGDCDDDQIWTMSVTRVGQQWRMLYTALAQADGGAVQKTGAAVSDDLLTWRKTSRQAVAQADPRWYETDPGEWGSVSWRDPKPVMVDGRWYATVAARENDGPLMRRGCAGLMSSDDFQTWRAERPLVAPRRYWDLECPQAFQIGDEWYLTAATMEDRRQRYWSSPAFHGPWEVPLDGGIFAPAGHYAGRVMRWQGSDLLWCWHQQRLDQGWMSDSRRVDWMSVRNPFGKTLAPPLVLDRRENGRLARKSFPGWVGLRSSDQARAMPAPVTAFQGQPADPGGWDLKAGGGMDVLLAASAASDADITLKLDLSCAAGGLAFRMDEEGGGYFVEFTPQLREASLVKWLPERNARTGFRGYRREVVQRETMFTPFPASEKVAVRLLVVGPYVEVSVRGEVVLATFTGERLTGSWGIWAESGAARADEVRIAPMRRPV